MKSDEIIAIQDRVSAVWRELNALVLEGKHNYSVGVGTSEALLSARNQTSEALSQLDREVGRQLRAER